MSPLAELRAGQYIAYRRGGRGPRQGLLLSHVERVSAQTTYVQGIKVRLRDLAHTSLDRSVLLHPSDEVAIIHG